MHLRPEDVQEIVSLLDSLSQDEFELRTGALHLTVRRAGRDGWTQETRVLTEPNVVSVPDAAAPSAERTGAQAQEARVLSTPDAGGERRAQENRPPSTEEGSGTGARDAAPPDREAGDGLVEIRAPLPGTFYRAPKPGADPYVEVGDRVAEDTVVGLIETMKLFNSVHANVRGEVVRFLVDDAGLADQDAVIALVRPER